MPGASWFKKLGPWDAVVSVVGRHCCSTEEAIYLNMFKVHVHNVYTSFNICTCVHVSHDGLISMVSVIGMV